MQLLDAPTRADELSSQPIQQLGMRWQRTTVTEIARRIYDSSSKVTLPNTVNHHARGEWVIRAGNPFGQSHTTALLGRISR